jgi:anhydro-N-acetylmuramic acid kinase
MEYLHQNKLSPSIIRAIGVMSGTSLDGLDLCFAEFTVEEKKWHYNIIKANTILYPEKLRDTLKSAMLLSSERLFMLNSSYGKWIGERINEFLIDLDIKPHLIGSHGHTVFHNPTMGFTTQIGSGAHIASITGIPCVCDFRSGDVARGGQGAPLVPIGDEFLFNEYDFCLNIGGIANVSYRKENRRIAYDICPANMALNQLSNLLGYEFDEDGKIGQSGEIDYTMLNQLDDLDFYNQVGAKSLGREWFEENFLPITCKSDKTLPNILRTLYEHIANQIAKSITSKSNKTVLITGGGAKNKFLIELIKTKTNNKIILPNSTTIDFKEALIFGFLAVLYQLRIPSCLASVTGAKNDSIGGCMYL